MTTKDTIISVKNLQKSFGQLNVLSGIDIDINRGDVVVVIGPSGSGKSTFLRCLNRLEESTGGNIFFEGEDITAKSVNINIWQKTVKAEMFSSLTQVTFSKWRKTTLKTFASISPANFNRFTYTSNP